MPRAKSVRPRAKTLRRPTSRYASISLAEAISCIPSEWDDPIVQDIVGSASADAVAEICNRIKVRLVALAEK